MRHTDQTSLVSPQGHIFPQGKKDNESDARQFFCISSFVLRVSGTYENDEEAAVIKSLWKKA
jgi:peptide methionine sulfoxide reductase MsrB